MNLFNQANLSNLEFSLIVLKRIAKFMKNFTDEDCSKIINHNFVCSDIFKWDIENWCPKKSEEEIMAKRGRRKVIHG